MHLLSLPVIALVLLMASLSALAQSQDEIGWPQCGNAVSQDEALRRLNTLRLQGTSCHTTSMPSAATLSAPLTAPSTIAPVRWNETLAKAAAAQAESMAIRNRMVHRDAFDRNLAARLAANGYRFSAASENIAVGYPSLDEVVDAWLASEAHCANLMDATVREIGLACSDARGEHGDRYWTLVLGAPRR